MSHGWTRIGDGWVCGCDFSPGPWDSVRVLFGLSNGILKFLVADEGEAGRDGGGVGDCVGEGVFGGGDAREARRAVSPRCRIQG